MVYKKSKGAFRRCLFSCNPKHAAGGTMGHEAPNATQLCARLGAGDCTCFKQGMDISVRRSLQQAFQLNFFFVFVAQI
jgi:hypothetical protein